MGIDRTKARMMPSTSWRGFKDLLDHFEVPRPRITDRPRMKTSKGGWQRVSTLSSA
jgi:hypothetical protein